MKKLIPVIILIIFIINGCTPPSDKENKLTEEYLAKYDSIKSYRTGPSRAYYLQLIALHPINPFQTYSIGSDSSNELVLDLQGVPSVLGSIFSTPDSTIFTVAEGVVVTNNRDEQITQKTLEFDEYDNSEKLHAGRIEFIVKSFQDKRFIRVWDLENPRVEQFEAYDWYEIDPNLIITANYEDLANPIEVLVPTSMGVQDKITFMGKVTFNYLGNEYDLLSEGGGFLMYGDETSGVETYGSGRYLYFDLPEEGNNEVVLDFNLGYNPPCSYSDVTTCRFPPKQNFLPFEIKAGEKYH